MHGGWIDSLGEVLLASSRATRAHSSPALLLKFGECGALYVSHVRDCDDNRVVWIEVFWVELLAGVFYLRATLIAIFLLNLVELVFHNLLAELWVVEDVLEIFYALHEFIVLIMQLVHAKTGEL